MVRFLSYSEITLGCVRRRARSPCRVQADIRALGHAQMHALGNRLDRQCRLPPDARRYSKLGPIALAPREQVSLFPTEPAQLLGNDRSGLEESKRLCRRLGGIVKRNAPCYGFTLFSRGAIGRAPSRDDGGSPRNEGNGVDFTCSTAEAGSPAKNEKIFRGP
jgi:hypothetical protein